jgi:hypothetical protein
MSSPAGASARSATSSAVMFVALATVSPIEIYYAGWHIGADTFSPASSIKRLLAANGQEVET